MMPVRSLETSFVLEPGVADRLIHRHVVPGRAAAVEAHRAPVDDAFRIERRRAGDLAAKAVIDEVLRCRDARFRLAQRGQHLLSVVADG